jgi:hypothetical protein
LQVRALPGANTDISITYSANYFSKIALFGFVCAILQPALLSPSRFSFPLHARTEFGKAIAAIGAGDEKGEPEFGALFTLK